MFHKLLIILFFQANPCWQSKCSNNGLCIFNLTLNNFTCNCFDGYNGTSCQNCKYIFILNNN
jgi:hypothetical protein